MVALLGPPPKEFLERTKGDRVQNWFDENGMWAIESCLRSQESY